MNILHITPDRNFAKKFILPLSIHQEKLGNNVTISAPAINDYIKSKSISTINLNTKLSKKPWEIFKTFFILKKNAKQKKIDCIIFHTSVDSVLLIFLTRLFINTKIIYINHGVPFAGYTGFLHVILKIIEYININFSHYSFAINPSMASLLNNLKFKNKRITPFTPGSIAGVPHRFLTFDEMLSAREPTNENIKKILFVGRFEKRKGLQDILTAISMVKSNVHLIVAGGSESDLSQFTYEKSKVSAVGFISDIDALYLQCDILCVPSHHEGMGQVYLEAATLGAIPICSDIEGPTDFIKNKKNGFALPPGEPEKIAECIDLLCADFSLLQGIQKEAFNSSLPFNQEIICESNARKIQKNIFSN